MLGERRLRAQELALCEAEESPRRGGGLWFYRVCGFGGSVKEPRLAIVDSGPEGWGPRPCGTEHLGLGERAVGDLVALNFKARRPCLDLWRRSRRAV